MHLFLWRLRCCRNVWTSRFKGQGPRLQAQAELEGCDIFSPLSHGSLLYAEER